MSVVRRFLLAPSLVRLIRKERGGARITEGYFAPQAGRTSCVRIDGQDCHLVLVTADADGRAREERTEVPRAHGDALMDVCAGKAVYERTTVPHGGRDVLIDRYVAPAAFDVASIAFDDAGAANAFAVPAWFGAEVTTDAAYERHTVAISGAPATGEVGLTNAALDAVLDLIEPRYGFGNLRRPSGGETRGPTVQPPAPARPVPPPPPAPIPEPVAQAQPEPPPPEPSPVPEPERAPEPVAVQAPPPEPRPAEAPPEPAPVAARTEPGSAETRPPETKGAEARPGDDKSDARINDVIESLSAALSAAIQPPRETAREDEAGAGFERWTVRPRRTTQQT